MLRACGKSLRSLARIALALSIALNALLVWPALAWADGDTPTPDKSPRCPDAPFRMPSGNWVLNAYNFGYTGGTHSGFDLVDKTKEFTTTSSYFPESKPPLYLPFENNDEFYARVSDVDYPENVTPVYSPVDGLYENVGRLYPIEGIVPQGFPGSVLITATLDASWAGTVPTTTIRFWLTHMSNQTGTVSYVVRPTGPIKAGDLIGYQGKGSTFPTHLHVGVYSSNAPYTGTYLAAEGVQDPTFYFNAGVSQWYYPTQTRDYPVICFETPVSPIEAPPWDAWQIGSTAISGYALDPFAITTTLGIDSIKLFRDGAIARCPSGNACGGGILLATLTPSIARPDVFARYGGQSLNSGWSYNWNFSGLSMGRHTISLYAHQTRNNKWLLMDVRYINVSLFGVFAPLIVR